MYDLGSGGHQYYLKVEVYDPRSGKLLGLYTRISLRVGRVGPLTNAAHVYYFAPVPPDVCNLWAVLYLYAPYPIVPFRLPLRE